MFFPCRCSSVVQKFSLNVANYLEKCFWVAALTFKLGLFVRDRKGGGEAAHSPAWIRLVCSVDKLDSQKINISLRKDGCEYSGSSFTSSIPDGFL